MSTVPTTAAPSGATSPTMHDATSYQRLREHLAAELDRGLAKQASPTKILGLDEPDGEEAALARLIAGLRPSPPKGIGQPKLSPCILTSRSPRSGAELTKVRCSRSYR
jgi:hypothetical protein